MEEIQKSINGFDLPSLPDIRIKSLHIKNFKAYDDWHMDFSDADTCKPFICFIGDNGTGKSTALNAIQLLFSNLDNYSFERRNSMLEKCVRHVKYSSYGVKENNDFLIEAEIMSACGNYQLQMNKNGFLKDHPLSIKSMLYRLCYYSRFDHELHQFQLIREKWSKFKILFESVTGFEIEETEDVFSASADPVQAEMMEKYVLGFTVKKPYETISHKECSNGERKVIKSFSTMLNLEMSPKIVLIDDIEMHVALGRHIPLIDAMQSCYPESQIFSTTHSYRITRCLKRKDQVYDLRKIRFAPIISTQPWRLYIIDEIDDALYKLGGLEGDLSQKLTVAGKKIRDACYLDINDLQRFREDVSNFLKEVSDLYIIRVLSC